MDKVQAGVHAVVDNLPTVHAVFLLQTRIKARFDVLDNQLPAKITTQAKIDSEIRHSYLSSLLTKSPKPGVSTTVKRRRTPFSSMSRVIEVRKIVDGRITI